MRLAPGKPIIDHWRRANFFVYGTPGNNAPRVQPPFFHHCLTMRIETELKLDYSSVLIRPKRSTLTSRSEVNLERSFDFFKGVPIMAANMDTTGTFEMAEVLARHKMITCLHKHYTKDELVEHFSKPRPFSVYTTGVGGGDSEKWNEVRSKIDPANVGFVCIDVANGYTELFINFVSSFREDNPDMCIIAGNVVTGDITEQLILAGADIVKVGIGPGSVCTTRLKTGVGYPQLSAVIECGDAAHGLDGRIIADGGCVTTGDVAKAFGGGADFVMVGGMLAGHDESGGELVEHDGKRFKKFYGMSSLVANELYAGGLDDYRAAEGREVEIPYRGPVETTLQDILGGLRSACTYVGAQDLRDLSKCTTFVRVDSTHNVIFEKNEA